MSDKPVILVISAASGTGKSSLSRALVESCEKVVLSVSHTTRDMRHGEVNGRDYFFVSEREFSAMAADGQFAEHAVVYGYRYGTAKNTLQSSLAAGKSVLLEIDWQGAQQVAETFSSTVQVFLLPPSLASLRKRLIERKRDAPAIIEQRLAAAKEDLKHCVYFDHWIVNDDFATALEDLRQLLSNHQTKHRKVPAELLRELGIAELQ